MITLSGQMPAAARAARDDAFEFLFATQRRGG